jgi:hypothetical protein
MQQQLLLLELLLLGSFGFGGHARVTVGGGNGLGQVARGR